MKTLKEEIVIHLANKFGITPKTVKKNIYSLSKNYPNLTKNALAQIYALKNNHSILRKLDKEDRATLPSTDVKREKITIQAKSNRTKIKRQSMFEYDTTDLFKKGHIDEIDKAYTYGCYTSVNILLRKIVENLIIDILKARFPEKKKENKELYYNTSQRRFKDFGVILKSLYDKRNDFGTESKAVERLYDLAIKFKSDANDKTHSWYHLVTRKSEIDDLNIEQIIDLVKRLEIEVEIRDVT